MSWNRIMFAVASPADALSPVMDKVVRLTAAHGAELELFHCLFDPEVARPGRLGSQGVEQDIRAFIDAKHQQLMHHVERLRAQGLRVRASVRWDEPVYEGIVRQVLRHEPQLLIVQASRQHERWALGEHDYRIIESCPCPLLLIKTERPYVECQLIAAVDPVLEGGKPAALDDAILQAANVFAWALAAKVWVFHARMPWRDVLRTRPSTRRRRTAESAYRRQVEASVTALARRYGITDKQVQVMEGYAAEMLPEFARSEAADVVALGVAPRPLLQRILIGHNAQALLDGLDCDLLLVKEAGWRSPISKESSHHVERIFDQVKA